MEDSHLLNQLVSGMCARWPEHGAAEFPWPLKEECKKYFKVLLHQQGGSLGLHSHDVTLWRSACFDLASECSSVQHQECVQTITIRQQNPPARKERTNNFTRNEVISVSRICGHSLDHKILICRSDATQTRFQPWDLNKNCSPRETSTPQSRHRCCSCSLCVGRHLCWSLGN